MCAHVVLSLTVQQPGRYRDGVLYRIRLPLFFLALYGSLYAVYSNHFTNPFAFDDFHAIVDNVHIRNLKNIPKFFVDPSLSSVLPHNHVYRPVVTSSLAVDYALGGGLRPEIFHRSMFSVFLLQQFVLFFLLRGLFTRLAPSRHWAEIGAGTAVLIASFHTVNAETLNYSISRSDSYSTAIALLAIWAACNLGGRWGAVLSFAFSLLAVLTKEQTIVIPGMIFLAEYLFRIGEGERFRRAFLKAAPALFGVLIGVGLYISLFSGQIQTAESRILYFATELWVITRYLLMMLLPVRLTADSDWLIIRSLTDERILVGALIVGLLGLTARYCSVRKDLTPVAFGIGWFFLALLTTSSFIPIHDVTNDHRMFFPLVGFSIATGWLFLQWMLSASQNRNTIQIATQCFLLLLFVAAHGYGAHQRNKVWSSAESLWGDVSQKSPKNGRGLMNYGLALMARGDYPATERVFLQALQLLPNYSVLHTNLGILYNAMGRTVEAERYFQSSKVMNGGLMPTAPYYYARWLFENGRSEEALKEVNDALTIKSSYYVALQLKFEILSALQDRKELERFVETLERIGEEVAPLAAEVRAFLASDFIELGAGKSASELLNLSLSAYQSGNFEQSLLLSAKVLELAPDSVPALNNMGAALNRLGRPAEAVVVLERALSIQPEFSLAKNNLREALSALGKKPVPK